MKRKVNFAAVFFVSVMACFADFSFNDLIETANLPQEKQYLISLDWLFKNGKTFDRDMLNKDSENARNEKMTSLKSVLDQTNSWISKDGKNIDLLLCRFLIYWIYNGINYSDYYQEMIDEGYRIEKLFPDDYRIYWMFGVFLAYGARPLESITQFNYIIDKIKPKNLDPWFWHSYATALNFADMPRHGEEALKKFATLVKNYNFEDDIEFRMTPHFNEPTQGKEIEDREMYQIQQREKGLGFLNRLFGIFMPFEKSWGLQTYNVKNNGSIITFTPPPISAESGKSITYTMVVEYSAYNSGGFEDYIKTKIVKLKTCTKKELQLGDYPFTVYEAIDPGIYGPIGGFKGYLVFLKRTQPSIKGFNVEAPVVSMIDLETRQPYYRPIPAYDRYDGEIYYAFILDCCGAIFDQAKTVFENFIKGIVFD